MSEQSRFDVFRPQRFVQKRIVEEVYLTNRQIVRGAPVPVE